jgi:hypothetical protein
MAEPSNAGSIARQSQVHTSKGELSVIVETGEKDRILLSQLSKRELQRLRREMMKQARVMLKGSVMTPRQVVYAARTMVDQALSREMQHGKTECSSTQ